MKKFILWILTSIWLGFWIIFAQNNVLPDSAEIEVKDTVYENEYVNVKITMMKNWVKMNNYNWSINMKITDVKWNELTTNECTLPNSWFYKFKESDLWSVEFQRGLSIKKEGTFYIEVSNMFDDSGWNRWKQQINVIKDNGNNNTFPISIISPEPDSQFIEWKLNIIATVSNLPNSKAKIYIDDNERADVDVDWQWNFTYTIPNIPLWKHTLRIDIPDASGNIKWQSDTISFYIVENSNSWIKDIKVNPENWLVVWDQTTISVFADEMIESIKMKLSDRPDKDLVMEKEANGEFSYNVYLEKWGWIDISLETSASNNAIINSYPSVKQFFVLDEPEIGEIKTETDINWQTAVVSWEILNWEPVTSYKLNYRAWDWDEIYWSWEEETTEQFKTFTNVPYDTTINVSITPIRKSATGIPVHWAAPKTIQFIITKENTCGNWTIDEWEDCDTCAIDMWDRCTVIPENKCGNWVIDAWENCDTCAIDLWDKCPVTKEPRCTVQNIATRTTKVWDNYYLVRDKVENVSKYIVYSSTTPEWYDKVKVYETTDTNYEYPFDYNAKEDQFLYFWIVWICDDWEELELSWATKVQVWPAENFLLLVCMTFLIYFWIKLFRETE